MSRCDDYCCNHGCNQGRDCPARAKTCQHCFGIGYDASGHPCTCTMPARVAKIGRKEHGKEPLRGSSWRRQLRDLAKWLLLCLVVMTLTPAVLWIGLA